MSVIGPGLSTQFQGQEAEAVIISMATSSGQCLPRNIEFLYSKNRFNVAVSRARSLAMLVASPKLLEVNCATPERMALVNTMCWFVAAAEKNSGQSPEGENQEDSGSDPRNPETARQGV